MTGKSMDAMEPFDPDMEFEELVLHLNAKHRPGSVTSGKTRNALIRAWALFAGRERCMGDLHTAITRHGSKAALARELKMSQSTLLEFESFFDALTDRHNFPPNAKAFRSAFAQLSSDEQLDFADVAADLLREPMLLRRLATASNRKVTKLLETALRAAELQNAIEHLRNLLDGGIVHESAYQSWCDEHSWAFGGTHQMRDELRRVHEDSIVDLLIPDIAGYRDVIELKRPDVKILKYDRSHKTYYFSIDVAKALGQVHKYMDRLHDVAREGLANHPHIVAYHPRATIVIGRSQDWAEAETDALRGLNQRLHGIDVMTYDHLMKRAEVILSNFRS